MGESQNGCFKKTKRAKFSEKQTFLPPDMHTYVLYPNFFKIRATLTLLVKYNKTIL